ncbi:MAG: hypothetical protein GY749_10060 [Desulfobacteraceae bacterium]|nr:hypothetical protein [Desulfobacteraceae bacterium]
MKNRQQFMKFKLYILIIGIVTVCSANIFGAVSGDVDNSGSIDLSDAILSLQICAGMAKSPNTDADVNGDHRIGLEEAVFAVQVAANIKETTIWYKDTDGDGYSDGTSKVSNNRPSDYYYSASELIAISGDNDDNDADVFGIKNSYFAPISTKTRHLLEYTLLNDNFDTDPFSTGRWIIYSDPGGVNHTPSQVLYWNKAGPGAPEACGPLTGYVYRLYRGTRYVHYNYPLSTTGFYDLKLKFWYRNDSQTYMEAQAAFNGVWITVANVGPSPVDGYGHAIWQKVEVPLYTGTYGVRFLLKSDVTDSYRRLDCISIVGKK